MSSNKTVTIADLDAAETQLEQLQTQYLNQFGWRQTCQVPGSMWLWRRDFADEDKRQMKWWLSALQRVPVDRQPSRPTSYGIVTVGRHDALLITMRVLDQQLREATSTAQSSQEDAE